MHCSMKKTFASALVLGLLLTGCTKSSDNSGSSPTPVKPGDGATTSCGVVVNGTLKNPVSAKDGELVQVVQVLSNNLMAISNSMLVNDRRLIKLQGIANASTSYRNTASIDRIESLTSNGAYFFKATKDCSVILGGAEATVGALLTLNGQSVAEDLISKDLSGVDSQDACSGALLGSCFSALEDDKKPLTAGSVGPQFLWKPDADKNGKLVIHVSACNVDIFVNGSKLADGGSGNGRCSTGRSPDRSGCGYPGAVVTVIDRQTGLPRTFGPGQTSLRIPNPCTRFEADYPDN